MTCLLNEQIEYLKLFGKNSISKVKYFECKTADIPVYIYTLEMGPNHCASGK